MRNGQITLQTCCTCIPVHVHYIHSVMYMYMYVSMLLTIYTGIPGSAIERFGDGVSEL